MIFIKFCSSPPGVNHEAPISTGVLLDNGMLNKLVHFAHNWNNGMVEIVE
jgi:hypothetical protein